MSAVSVSNGVCDINFNGIIKVDESECKEKCGSVLDQIISRSGTQEKIHVKDAGKVEKIIQEMVACGPKQLQVITDFDATLSVYSFEGKRCDTSYGLITNSRFTSDEVKAKAQELFLKYHPYESDMSISEEERVQKMAEWYDLKHENYLKSSVKLRSSDIADLVRKSHMRLRDRSHEVLKRLHLNDVPLLVFSAGSGNSVQEILKQNEISFPNVQVIGNFMEFDEKTQEVIGFKKPTIHPGNKNEAAVHSSYSTYFESLDSRHNALVIGDNIGDADMANGLPNTNALLKIGFLNYNIEQQLDVFKDTFDVVLVDDQTFHFIDALLDFVLRK